jgi:hypothetical protein
METKKLNTFERRKKILPREYVITRGGGYVGIDALRAFFAWLRVT